VIYNFICDWRSTLTEWYAPCNAVWCNRFLYQTCVITRQPWGTLLTKETTDNLIFKMRDLTRYPRTMLAFLLSLVSLSLKSLLLRTGIK